MQHEVPDDASALAQLDVFPAASPLSGEQSRRANFIHLPLSRRNVNGEAETFPNRRPQCDVRVFELRLLACTCHAAICHACELQALLPVGQSRPTPRGVRAETLPGLQVRTERSDRSGKKNCIKYTRNGTQVD